ncbi:aminopeptidase [Kiritimatiellota bacterium B12222]|nr:aminopeptidase [Kiritimatiellota bacterium B12222]
MDIRTQNLARTMAGYCLDAQPREAFAINATTAAAPLVEALYEELLKAGAWPLVRMMPDGAQEAMFRSGQDHHFDESSPVDQAIVGKLAGSASIYSSRNTRSLSGVDPDLQARMAKASRPVKNKLLKKKWTLTLFPTEAYAQDAEMSLRDFEDFVYSATFSDEDNPVKAWFDLKKKQDKLISKLEGAKEVQIIGPGTDLTMSIEGRTFINSAGTHNMPSGEVFTGPVETSAEGVIAYDFPVVNQGREIDGIRLVFEKGVVVEATATKNQDFLLKMLDMDPGARRLGELGIGTNYRIQKFIKTILFDEKIGGTIHLALGASYTETGGKNKSGLHWDMIKDLRKGGELRIDGKAIQKDGKFLKSYFTA